MLKAIVNLKQNVLHKLTDDAVSKEDRNVIVNKIFGIADEVDTICFEAKFDDFEKYCSEKSDIVI